MLLHCAVCLALIQCVSANDSVHRASFDNGGDCKVCNQGGPLARKLFIEHRRDGIGARASAINAGMALAAKHGMNFGGVVHGQKKPFSHGIDTLSLLKTLYGSESFLQRKMPQISKTFDSVSVMEAFFENGTRFHDDGANVLLKGDSAQAELDEYISNAHKSLNAYFTPEFLHNFRQASHFTHEKTPLFKPYRPTVAIHLRRGDVTKHKNANRFTDDKFVYKLAHQLRKHLSNPDIHVWSSTEQNYDASDFDGYEKQGMTVHLNTPEREAWAHFAQADVLVLAKSSFSHAPAFLNPKCVIYQRFWHHPLNEWTVALPAGATPVVDDDDLKRCLARSITSRSQLMRRATMNPRGQHLLSNEPQGYR